MMNEVEFRKWMLEDGKNKKVVGDTISRLKRVEREIGHCDIDNEYQNDRCSKLLDLFSNKGENDEMKKYNTSFPIGKYHMSTYRHAIKQYVKFLDSIV